MVSKVRGRRPFICIFDPGPSEPISGCLCFAYEKLYGWIFVYLLIKLSLIKGWNRENEIFWTTLVSVDHFQLSRQQVWRPMIMEFTQVYLRVLRFNTQDTAFLICDALLILYPRTENTHKQLDSPERIRVTCVSATLSETFLLFSWWICRHTRPPIR